jgi:hypothetical protein
LLPGSLSPRLLRFRDEFPINLDPVEVVQLGIGQRGYSPYADVMPGQIPEKLWQAGSRERVRHPGALLQFQFDNSLGVRKGIDDLDADCHGLP